MRGALVIARREFFSLWKTPLAWSLLVLFSLIQGGIFVSLLQNGGTELEASPLYAYYGQDSLLTVMSLLLLCPALCMRSLAEERRSGGHEYLLSSPVSNAEIGLGKFLAPLATFVIIGSITLVYPISTMTVEPVDWARVTTAYLALFLVGMTQLSISLLASALARTQLTAFLFASMAVFGQYVFSLGEFLYADGPLRVVASSISFSTFLDEAARGILDFRRIFLNLSLTAACLLATIGAIETWREE